MPRYLVVVPAGGEGEREGGRERECVLCESVCVLCESVCVMESVCVCVCRMRVCV